MIEQPTTEQPMVTLNDGRAMPQIGLGTWQVAAGDAAALVEAAASLGYRAVDTAKAYDNEAPVGEGVRRTQATMFVTTKVWKDDMGYDAALRAFDRSFGELGLDWIDLYLIHWPQPWTDFAVATWRALIRLRDEGRVKSIGVSNFNMDHLERIIDATGVVPAVNQIECHPRFQQVELRAFNAENGIVTTSWSPLGKAAVLDDPVIVRIAEKHGRTPAQVVLRWHLEQGLIAIPKTARIERLRENLEATEFALDAEDMAAVARLDDPGGRIGPDPELF